MSIEKFIIFVTIIVSVSSFSLNLKQTDECCEEYCYELDPSRPQYKDFATKTPYELVKGNNIQQYSVPGCESEKIWILSRHGSRLPSSQSMQLLKELEKLRDEIIILYNESKNGTQPQKGKLCDDDSQLLQNWKWDSNMTGEYDEFLTNEGWNEVKQLAQDYRAAFSPLIGNEYSPEKFIFRHTDFQRSEASYKAFVEGLFGDESYNNITLDPPPKPDMLLMPYEQCEIYKQNIIAHDGPDGDLVKFRNSDIYRKFRSDLTQKLGSFSPAFQTLSDINITNIWEMCRFDKNWNMNKSSPWCATLTQSQIKILEYHEDLNYYLKTSYGSAVNSKLACHTMEDMLRHLNSNDSPKLIAYFGHIAIIHLHLTAMEAFKDAEAIQSDNYDRMANRKWRTSEICPFTANLAAVKYYCPNDNDATYKVKFFLNQKQLELDWCDDGVCKLQDVVQKYSLFNNGVCSEIYCSGANVIRSNLFYLFAIINWVIVVKIFFVKA